MKMPPFSCCRLTWIQHPQLSYHSQCGSLPLLYLTPSSLCVAVRACLSQLTGEGSKDPNETTAWASFYICIFPSMTLQYVQSNLFPNWRGTKANYAYKRILGNGGRNFYCPTLRYRHRSSKKSCCGPFLGLLTLLACLQSSNLSREPFPLLGKELS